MARWFIRFTLAIFLLFFGVLFGMQQAHEGIKRMRGYADPSFPSVIDMKKGENGELEAAVFGRTVVAGDLEEKQETIRELKTFNLFSRLGQLFADAVTALMETLLSLAGRALD
ncbi:YqxA family protein [Geobacillus jurassicus]|uniref:YqxA family protein n=1 Tax=Geobacillus jurassicus TaxID=235932 RepID=A0ABV6GV67_9BACL|nr:YqxA family protein [Geobacillus jurassicus]